MIRIIKLGNFIYENIEPKTIDENGERWNIPSDIALLKEALIDTIDWQLGRVDIGNIRYDYKLQKWRDSLLNVINNATDINELINLNVHISQADKIELSLDDERQIKIQEIAYERWKEETGGITLNGVDIATDRGSQALLAGAVLKAQDDPGYVVNWKAKNGWFQIDAATLTAIADAVRAHVQACFDKERELQEKIMAATSIEELEAIKWE